MAELTDKQKRFCDEYLIDLNGAQAAIRAGYSADTAKEQASRLLTNVNVQNYIQERQQEIKSSTNITQERVLQELAKIAFVDIREAFGPDNQLHDIRQLDDDTAAALASVESVEMRSDGMVTGETKKIRFHNKITALDLIGKHLGMYDKDNAQRRSDIVNVINLGSGVKPPEEDE